MPRDFFISGESLVKIKGNVSSSISVLTELGLTEDQISVQFNDTSEPLHVNAWGPNSTVDVQIFPGDALVHLNLIHYDDIVLRECLRLSRAAPLEGQLARAGTRMGAGLVRFAAGNFWMGLNILSPVANLPYRFYYARIVHSLTIPLGTQKSVVRSIWQVVPYTPDPWQSGLGALGTTWYDRILDT